MQVKGDLLVKRKFTTGGDLIGKITTVTGTYAVLVTDETIVCNNASAFTVTLPVAVVGQQFRIKNIGAGKVTVACTGADVLDGSATQVLHQWEGIFIQCPVVNAWIVV